MKTCYIHLPHSILHHNGDYEKLNKMKKREGSTPTNIQKAVGEWKTFTTHLQITIIT